MSQNQPNNGPLHWPPTDAANPWAKLEKQKPPEGAGSASASSPETGSDPQPGSAPETETGATQTRTRSHQAGPGAPAPGSDDRGGQPTKEVVGHAGQGQQAWHASRSGLPAGVRWILLDIEGTTCPVSFVAETLFPYASSHLEGLIASSSDNPDVQALLQEVEQAWADDADPAARELRIQHKDSRPDVGWAAYLQWLIRSDRKLPALKELQGMVWQQGYATGDLQAPLFADVPQALKRWHAAGIGLAVYSSGSVAAQKLLYGHTAEGDLRPLFQHWFDTRTGPKCETDSYVQIISQLGSPPDTVLFISDAKAELQAAQEAGLHVSFSLRPGNPEQDPGPFPVIHDYSGLHP